MAQEKFVLTRKNKRRMANTNSRAITVRIRTEDYVTLHEWIEETGLPLVQLYHKCLEYAKANLEWQE